MERAAPIICTVVVPVAGHEAFVLPSSAVEVWAGNGARGRGMRYSLELIVFVGAPTCGLSFLDDALDDGARL